LIVAQTRPSAEFAFKMHLCEPQEREHEAPDAKPEHDYQHLAKVKIPASLGEVSRNSCHQVNVSNHRQRQQCQKKKAAKTGEARMQEYKPGDLCDNDRPDPKAPPSKCWSFGGEAHIEV